MMVYLLLSSLFGPTSSTTSFARIYHVKNENSPLSNMRKPRRLVEIDGLRAVALVAVLLYHAKLGTFLQGGFCGVDVFFVISGYVVSLSLLRQIRADKFTFSTFLVRRIHRLSPALLATILCGNEVVRRTFTQEHCGEASKLAMAASFSVSNFVLWLQSNYFDTESSLKPYLHTWSLSVEWQFYLTWALLARFVYKRIERKRVQLQILSGITLFSVVSTAFVVSKHPSAAFYNIMFRYFEFMFGAVPAWYAFMSSKPSSIDENAEIAPVRTWSLLLSDLYAFLGMSVILAYFMAFKDSYPFPGLTVVPLCFASALIIIHSSRSYLGKILRHKLMLWLGEISYSVYLVHWPMLVFLDYVLLSKSTSLQRLFTILLSIPTGHLLNRVVERPFHMPHSFLRPKTKNIVIVLFASITVLQSYYLSSSHCNVIKSRNVDTWITSIFNKSKKLKFKRKNENRGHFGLLCHMTGRYPKPTNFEKCNPRAKTEIVLFGDSHAQDFYAALNSSLFPNIRVIQLTAAGFSFTEQFRDGPYKHCKVMYDMYPKLLEPRRTSIIAAILASRWKPAVKYEDLQRLNNTLDYFQNYLRVPVFVIGPRPEFSVAPLRVLETHTKFNTTRQEIEQIFDDSVRFKDQVDGVLRSVIEARNATYITSYGAFCERGKTAKCRIIAGSGKLIYYTDRHHINSRGARKIADPVIRRVKKLASGKNSNNHNNEV